MKKLLVYLICLSLLLSACSHNKSNKASDFTTRTEVEEDELAKEIGNPAPHEKNEDDKSPTETKRDNVFSRFRSNPPSYDATTSILSNHNASWFGAETVQCLKDNCWNEEIFLNSFVHTPRQAFV